MNCIRILRLAEKTRFNILSARYVSRPPPRFLETQDMWRRRDDVSKRWQLIYKGPMDRALNVASAYLTFTTAAVSLGGVYYITFVYDYLEANNPIVLGDDVVVANSPTEALIYLGTFIALNIAVKIFLSKYVLRLYRNGDEYLAVFRGHFYNSINKHKFHLNDFKKLKPTFFVSWGDARYDLGNKHGIILENYFKSPDHFNYLLNKDKKNDPNNDN